MAVSFWEAKDLRHGLMLMTSQETFEFGSSLATWLNALQVTKCSALVVNQGTNDEMFGASHIPSPGVYETFFRKAAEE